MATIDAGQVIPSVGTVTKVSAGGAPSVTLNITNGIPKLNFGLVTGDKGDNGKDGVSVTAATIDSTGHLILTLS